MTSNKPFTDEELDTFMRREATVDDFERLIAQSREEIQLRARLHSWADQLRAEHNIGKFIADELETRMGRIEGPAARAKRELGEWLAQHQRWAYSTEENTTNWSDAERWTCLLFTTTMSIRRLAPTEAEAILSALQAARGER